MPPCSTEASKNWGLLTPDRCAALCLTVSKRKLSNSNFPSVFRAISARGRWVMNEWGITPLTFLVSWCTASCLPFWSSSSHSQELVTTLQDCTCNWFAVGLGICNFVSLIKEKQWIQNSESKLYFFLDLRVLCCPGWSCGKSAHIQLK